jgi:hypothetical protein
MVNYIIKYKERGAVLKLALGEGGETAAFPEPVKKLGRLVRQTGRLPRKVCFSLVLAGST